MTMRVKLPNGFRFGFTGTPIDRTMQNTHRDFGPLKDGVQERYLSYYGIRRAIQDGATLEVHYIRDKVPFQVDEEALNVGFEQMCEEMELEDEEAKDFVQRQRSQWKELARHPDRIEIVLERMLDALPGASRPERLQGAARRRRPQGLRALQGRARRQAEGARPAARVVRRDHLRGPEQRARGRALRVREGEAGRADRLLQAHAGGVGGVEPRALRRGPQQVATAAQDPDRLRPAADRLRRAGRAGDVPRQAAARPQPAAGHRADQPAAARDEEAHRRRGGLLRRLHEPGEGAQLRREHPRGVADRLGRAASDCAGRGRALHGALRGHHHRRHAGVPAGGAAAPARLRRPRRTSSTTSRAWNGCGRPSRPIPASTRTATSTTGCAASTSPTGAGSAAARTPTASCRPRPGSSSRRTRPSSTSRSRCRSSRSTRTTSPSSTTCPSPADKAAALEAVLTGELSEDDPSFIYRQLGERLQRIKERKDAGDEATAAPTARSCRRSQRGRCNQAGAGAPRTSRNRGSTGCSRSCERMHHGAGRGLRRRLRAAHGRAPARQPAALAGLEQLDRRAHARRAVAAGRVVESPIRCPRIRS